MDFSKRIIAPHCTTAPEKSFPRATVAAPKTQSPRPDVPVAFEKDTNKLVTLKELFETAKVKSETTGVMFTPLITK